MLNKLLALVLFLNIIVVSCVGFALTSVSGQYTVAFGNNPMAVHMTQLAQLHVKGR